MKKILIFIDAINDGGAETIVKEYAIQFMKMNYNVKIVTIYSVTSTANYQQLVSNGIDIINVFRKYTLKEKVINKFIKNIYVSTFFKKIIINEKPDIIHLNMVILKYFAPIYKYLKGIKLFYTCHSLPERYFGDNQKNEYRAAKKLIKNLNLQLIALHPSMANELNRMFSINNTVVIKNGVDFDKLRNVYESKNSIRKSLGICENTFVIGHIGRFAASKNHKFIISIFEELCKRINNSFLLLIGNGELLTEIQMLINKKNLNDKVLILSHRSDIPRLLKAMDVFIFPSKFEGLGIALIEAQVSGLRCIVSDSIPHEAILSDKTIPMSLEKTPSDWCDAVIDKEAVNTYFEEIDKYNILKEVLYLEKLYNK